MVPYPMMQSSACMFISWPVYKLTSYFLRMRKLSCPITPSAYIKILSGKMPESMQGTYLIVAV